MQHEAAPRRITLALLWAAFVVVWITGALFTLALTGLGPCGGDGGSPYAAPASAAGRYCTAVESYFDSGEPGELTTALVYLWPIALLICLGAVGVWQRSRRALVALAVVATALLVVHAGLAFNLPDRCRPDDPDRPGCRHY